MNPILECQGVCKSYSVRGGRRLEVLLDVDLTVLKGRTTAIVGESGAGKSTLARVLVGLVRPDAGTVRFGDMDVLAQTSARAIREYRRHVQLVLQDPYSALDPRQRVIDSASEPLSFHFGWDRRRRRAHVVDLFDRLGLSLDVGSRRPAELSGGQLQRVVISRALALAPSVIIWDEPTAALDVSVQAQVLAIMRDIQTDFELSYVVVSHDLAVVRSVADQVTVMRDGRVVEEGQAEATFGSPRHPFTADLLAAARESSIRRASGAPIDPVSEPGLGG